MHPQRALTDLVRKVHDVCENIATGGGANYEAYEAARQELLEEPSLSGAMPEWLRKARTGSQYWSFIKAKARTYAERRQIIADAFHPLFGIAEIGAVGPIHKIASALVDAGSPNSVMSAWNRCLERHNSDPEGAITAARAMLESICKFILEERSIKYTGNEELPKLYGLVAAQLGLNPGAHEEEVFRRILGGCQSVVEGLGTLRNRLGDAHGRAPRAVRPKARHAQLAVNLAGTMSLFLIETHIERVVGDRRTSKS